MPPFMHGYGPPLPIGWFMARRRCCQTKTRATWRPFTASCSCIFRHRAQASGAWTRPARPLKPCRIYA